MLDVVDLKSINGMSALGTCQAWVVENGHVPDVCSIAGPRANYE